MKGKKSLILYAYHESSKNAICNLRYFLRKGIRKEDCYSFYININGDSELDFNAYLKKYKNLKILKSDGRCGWDGWKNIINKVNIRDYKYFIFIKDNVIGPRNLDTLDRKKTNWIDDLTKNIKKGQDVITCAYGISLLGILYKFPYVSEKFFCTNISVLKEMKKNNIFEKMHYDSGIPIKKRVAESIEKNKDNRFDHLKNSSTDIQLAYFLLEHNFNYVAYDINGINNINVLKHYKHIREDSGQCYKLVKDLYKNQNKNLKYRLFWTNKGSEKGFLKNNEYDVYDKDLNHTSSYSEKLLGRKNLELALNKTLILYSFCGNYKNSQSNIKFFLEKGLIEDAQYKFYINIGGKININFDKYTSKYENLKIFRNKNNGWEGWKNIIEDVNIKDYRYYIFITDKVNGPKNTHTLKGNWIDNITNNIRKGQDIIINRCSVIELKKLYKLPYIEDHFFCTSRAAVKSMLDDNIFKEYVYNFSKKIKSRVIDSIKNSCSSLISRYLKKFIEKKQKKIKHKKNAAKKYEKPTKEYISWLKSGGNVLKIKDYFKEIKNIDLCGTNKGKNTSDGIKFTHFLLKNKLAVIIMGKEIINGKNILECYKKNVNFLKLTNELNENKGPKKNIVFT